MTTTLHSLLSLAFILFFSVFSYGQKIRWATAQDLEELKTRKTVFVYRDSDDLESMKKAFKEGWSLSEIVLTSFDKFEAGDFNKDDYSFIVMKSSTRDKNAGATGSSADLTLKVTYIYLSFWMYDGETQVFFGGTYFSSDFATLKQTEEINLKNDGNEAANMMAFGKFFYKEASVIHNWSAGRIKNILQLWEAKLVHPETHPTRHQSKDEISPEIGKLATGDTLYLTNNFLVRLAPLSGDESKLHDPEELMEKYPFPYRFVTAEELSMLILEGKHAVHYLTTHREGGFIFFDIINGLSGESEYYHRKVNALNNDSKDFKQIAAAAAKQSK